VKNKSKIAIYTFLILAFGIAWLAGLVIFLTGGLVSSPELIANTGITLALVLLASVYMWGPAIAHILSRWITKEGWNIKWLKPNLKTDWRFWLVGWFAPGLLIILGTVLFFLILPGTFDPELGTLQAQLSAVGAAEVMINPSQIIIGQTLVALLIAPALNLIATFGEEFGWRAYLLPKLLHLGKRKALVISALIWGIWHWPVIAMGHNYGLDYPGFPWLGLAATLWFSLSIGVFFGWLAIKAESVWPAVFAHGALNGMAAIGLLFVKPPYSMLLGPSPAGVFGVLPFTLVSLIILIKAKD